MHETLFGKSRVSLISCGDLSFAPETRLRLVPHFGFLRSLQTIGTSTLAARSLSSVASAPSDLAGSSIFPCKKPETTTILSSGCLDRIARNTSNPSRSGMLKSRVIKSILVFSTAVKASLPELLSSTEYPAPSSILLNNLRSSGLSSTTKIDCSFVSAIFHSHPVINLFFQIWRDSASPSGQGESTQKPPPLEVYADSNSDTLNSECIDTPLLSSTIRTPFEEFRLVRTVRLHSEHAR
jgi:hypothetical protein